jgi:hypothetical protein
MNRILIGLALGTSLFFGLATSVQATDITLARLDCGTPQAPTVVNERFSDTYAFPGLKVQFVFSCYLIKHGDDYMLWDTGHSMTAPNVAPKVSVVDQLAKIDVKPEHHHRGSNGVPAFNFDRAQTSASIERLRKIAGNLNATVIIQHDQRDVDKLPVFPDFAK